MCWFTVFLHQMDLLAANGWAVSFARFVHAFGFGSFTGRLLGARVLLRLQGILPTANAEEVFQDVRRSLLQVNLAGAHGLCGGAEDLLLGHGSYWSAQQL